MTDGANECKFLRLNFSKCEIVMFSTDWSAVLPTYQVDESALPAGDAGKCLGYWWKGDLSATKSVEENIANAWHAFFHYGSIGGMMPIYSLGMRIV